MGESARHNKYLGVNFGYQTRIPGFVEFGSEGYLIEIGDNVTIANGVLFHTHDGGVGILRDKYPEIDVFKPIKVGNFVFIIPTWKDIDLGFVLRIKK